MATVVLSAYGVAAFPEGGGHFWVYMQYAQGLRRLGCDVYWLECLRRGKNTDADARAVATLRERMQRFGLGERVLLYKPAAHADAPIEYIGVTRAAADALLRSADLVLNFHYAIDPRVLACARRTALIDIDPGLLQVWLSTGQLHVPPHDCYFTIGETVGTPQALFPDCGLPWVRIRPPVCLARWPFVHDGSDTAFTTVAGWWSGKWVRAIENGREVCYDNNKRVAFLEYVTLPGMTRQPLELALNLGAKDGPDKSLLERHGWRVRYAHEVAGTPEQYQSYIQHSRGEFSCAKPSCMKLQNAWISDRTLCYLASGKPAVVQHTGPSGFLPNGDGLHRFTTLAEAAEALDAVNADYERQCHAARDIAEAYFDSDRVLDGILAVALR